MKATSPRSLLELPSRPDFTEEEIVNARPVPEAFLRGMSPSEINRSNDNFFPVNSLLPNLSIGDKIKQLAYYIFDCISRIWSSRDSILEKAVTNNHFWTVETWLKDTQQTTAVFDLIQRANTVAMRAILVQSQGSFKEAFTSAFHASQLDGCLTLLPYLTETEIMDLERERHLMRNLSKSNHTAALTLTCSLARIGVSLAPVFKQLCREENTQLFRELGVFYRTNIGQDLHTMEVVDDDGHPTPLLCYAASRGTEEMVQYLLLQEGIDANVCKPQTGDTPLIHAAWRYPERSLNMLRVLLEKGANPNAQNKQGRTALITAYQRNHPQSVERLLEAGADATLTDAKGKTALYYAKSAQAIKFLLDCPGINPDAQDQLGETALMRAVQLYSSSPECIKLLCDRSNLHLPDHKGQTALMHACIHHHHSDATLLLLVNDETIRAQDKSGKTPFMHLVQNSSYELSSTLVQKFQLTFLIRDKENKTAFHYAVQGHGMYPSVCAALCQMGDKELQEEILNEEIQAYRRSSNLCALVEHGIGVVNGELDPRIENMLKTQPKVAQRHNRWRLQRSLRSYLIRSQAAGESSSED